jgi:hypothetical protein
LESGAGLNLALGTERYWLASGKPVGIAEAPTHFGRVSWSMQYHPAKSEVTGHVQFAKNSSPAWAAIHVRLPGGVRVTGAQSEPEGELLPDGKGVRWKSPRGTLKFVAKIAG